MGERVEDPSRVKNLERSELSNRLGDDVVSLAGRSAWSRPILGTRWKRATVASVKPMSFERTSIDELYSNGELEGVAVVSEHFGTGEVVDDYPEANDDEVLVEFGREDTVERVLVDNLKVDSEYYGGLKSSDAGFDFALERGLVPTRWEAAMDGQGFEDPADESPVEVPDGWNGGAVEQTGGFVLCRIWRTYEDVDDAREVEFEAIYGSERHVSIHAYTEDPDYGLTYDQEIETRVAEPNTDEEKARIAKDMMDEFDREAALDTLGRSE